MRNQLTFLICILVTLGLQAQQEAQYTQFMFNKLALNPGYAGNSELACISILHRSQWVGLEGAPESQVINFHTPLKNNRIGLGMSILHDKIGPTSSWSYQLKYSYRIPIANGKLGVGLQGSVRRFRVDWNDTHAIQTGDGLLSENPASKVLPNFGLGLYYQSSSYYLGISVPNMLKGDLSFYEGSDYSDNFSKETPHYYLMGGLILNAGRNMKFKPALLVKFTENSPVKIDINAMIIFYDKLWLGATYRMGGNIDNGIGESVDAILQYQITSGLRAGIAYDYTLSKMRSYNTGTYEIMLDYCINKKDQMMTNPRFF